jgi:hypothetical protein
MPLNHLLTSRVRQTVKPYIERKISKSDAPYNMTFKCVTAYHIRLITHIITSL